MPHLNLDKTDLKILQVLQENGRLSNVELSEKVALSPSPCLRRLKQLEDAGIIQKYAAQLSPVSLGLGLQAFIRVSISKAKDAREDFSESVRAWPEVLDTLLSHHGVQDAQSSFVLKEIKNTTALPLVHLVQD